MCKVQGLQRQEQWLWVGLTEPVLHAVLRNGGPAGPGPHTGRLFLGEPYMGLAGCPACLLRILFGPYPRPRGLVSLLGVTAKGLFSGHSYL